MKFALATVYVMDMEKSLAFYNELLGIPIISRQPFGPGKELVFLGIDGQANLELIPAEGKVIYSGFSIGFEVEDLKAVKEKLSQSGYAFKREASPQEGLTLCFFEGPNGEEVELIEHR